MTGKLYGIGVGPGDPGLLTLKALKILKEVDYIAAPFAGANDQSTALEIIKQEIDVTGRLIKLYFAMARTANKLEQSRTEAAAKVEKFLSRGKNVAFITIGDPLLYSTYIYILEKVIKLVPGVQIETVPGISSIQASAAGHNYPLAVGEENITILTEVRDRESFKRALSAHDTIVVLKLSKNIKTVYQVLVETEPAARLLYVSRCGQPEEISMHSLTELKPEKVEYLSLMIITQGELQCKSHL